jgi:hypothetical protein
MALQIIEHYLEIGHGCFLHSSFKFTKRDHSVSSFHTK